MIAGKKSYCTTTIYPSVLDKLDKDLIKYFQCYKSSTYLSLFIAFLLGSYMYILYIQCIYTHTFIKFIIYYIVIPGKKSTQQALYETLRIKLNRHLFFVSLDVRQDIINDICNSIICIQISVMPLNNWNLGCHAFKPRFT